MKLLAFPLLLIISGIFIYFFNRKRNYAAIIITCIITVLLLGLGVFGMYKAAVAPDTQCTTTHQTFSQPPLNLVTPLDYFSQGNYDYDTGNCVRAIADYTKAIALDPNYPQAYNNRAYTYMRMQQYAKALPDLDRAIQLNPKYVEALMNRGDIHNYYYYKNRQAALNDYQRVIALGAKNTTSVCGHLFLAKHAGWNIGTLFGLLTGEFLQCK